MYVLYTDDLILAGLDELRHFQDYVVPKGYSIHTSDTADKPADFLTKPLSQEMLKKHRKTVKG